MPHILVHGYGNFPIFLKPIIEIAQEEYPSFSWSCILSSPHHFQFIQSVLERNHILCCSDAVRNNIEPVDLSLLQNYPENFFKTLEADKGLMKEKRAELQTEYALKIYKVYKEFLLKVKPSYILFPLIESVEGVILFNLGKELNIKNIIITHARHIGRSFFSSEIVEMLPAYAAVTGQDIECADVFLKQFRNSEFQAANFVNPYSGGKVYTFNFPPLPIRIIRRIKYAMQDPMEFTKKGLRVSLLNSVFPWFRDFYRGARRIKNARYNSISDYSQLPCKFIYYPLQYSPEASINIPAPEYIDQRKAIDAIRFAMPNDTVLVVKEHPACISVRSGRFVKSLLKCAGVVVADYRMTSKEIISRAALTVSVTGSATIEAFLMGRPSISLGTNLYSEFWGGKCELDNLRERINAQLDKTIPDEEILNAVAKIYNVSSPFAIRAEAYAKIPANMIKVFLDSLFRHIERLQMER